jgi:hypothetical protein
MITFSTTWLTSAKALAAMQRARMLRLLRVDVERRLRPART